MPNYDNYNNILAALTSCKSIKNKIFLFKNKDYDEKSSRHYHLALPISKNEYILLVMFLSKVEKIARRYKLIGRGEDSLVFFNKDDMDFLTAEKSVLDCNKPIYLSFEELASKVYNKLSIFECNIADEYIALIKQAIKKSPEVKPTLKKKLL